jgi:hypothetical protein
MYQAFVSSVPENFDGSFCMVSYGSGLYKLNKNLPSKQVKKNKGFRWQECTRPPETKNN